jgi:hypothetical protein
VWPRSPATGQATRTASVWHDPRRPTCSTWNSPNEGARQRATPRGAGTSTRRRQPRPSGTPKPGALSGRWHGHRPRSGGPDHRAACSMRSGRPLAMTSFAAGRATRSPAPAALRTGSRCPVGQRRSACWFSDRVPIAECEHELHLPCSTWSAGRSRGRRQERCGRLVRALAAVARLFHVERPRRSADLTSATGGHGAAGRAVRAAGQGTGRRLPLAPSGTPGPSRVHSRPVATGQASRNGAGAWSAHWPPSPACSTWNTRSGPGSLATGGHAGGGTSRAGAAPAQGRSAPRPLRAERLSPGTRLRWVAEPVAPRVSRGTSGRDVSRGTPLGARRA